MPCILTYVADKAGRPRAQQTGTRRPGRSAVRRETAGSARRRMRGHPTLRGSCWLTAGLGLVAAAVS